MATRIRDVLCVQAVQTVVGAGNLDYTCTMGFSVFEVCLYVIIGTAAVGVANLTRSTGGGFNNVIGGSGNLNANSSTDNQRADSLIFAQSIFSIGDTLRLTTVGGTTLVAAHVAMLPTTSQNPSTLALNAQ